MEFNFDTFEISLQLLNGDDESKIDGLQILSNFFLYGIQEILILFPADGIIKVLLEILSGNKNQAVLNLAAECIRNYSEASQGALLSLINNNFVKIALEQIKCSECKDYVQSLIEIVCLICELSPKTIEEEVGVELILIKFNMLSLLNKKKASNAMVKMTENSSNENDINYLDEFLTLLETENEEVVSSVIKTIDNVIRDGNKEKVPISFLPILINAVNTYTFENLVVILRILVLLSTLDNFAEEIINSSVDYERLLFNDHQGSTSEVKKLALNVVLNLLPDVDFPNEYWSKLNRNLKGTPKFAKEIKPILLKLLLDYSGWEALTLAGLAAIQQVTPFEPTNELLNAMVGLLKSNTYSHFVLLLTRALPNPKVFLDLGTVQLFKDAEINSNVKEWYDDRLNQLLEKYNLQQQTSNIKKFKDLDDLCNYILNNDLWAFQLIINNTLQQFYDFIKNLYSIPTKYKPAIQKIVKLTEETLKFLPMDSITDPLRNINLKDLLSKTIVFNFKISDENIKEIPVALDLDFSGIQAWYNFWKKLITKDSMLEEMKKSKFNEILILENVDKLYNTQKGLFDNILNVPGGKHFHFRLNGHDFSSYDLLFHSIARSFDNITDVSNVLDLEFIEGDIPRSKLIVPNNIHKDTLLSLRILEKIHEFYPEMDLKQNRLLSRVLLNLPSLILTCGFISPSSQIIYHFPFLFDFETRKVLFKIISYDLNYSIPFIEGYFFKKQMNLRLNNAKVKCHIRRDHLLEDGKIMIEGAGPGMFRPDVYFDNEEGIGAGPTQEFFTLFSYELCKKSRNLWRDNSLIDSEYCWTELGLFPKPNASPELFYIIGLLCGKSILMDMVLPIHFNPAFFKLIKSEKITLDEVDPILERSLKMPDGLIDLPFTYPGIPELELVKDGSNIMISKDNFSEYVRLVKKFTLDITEIVEQFKLGFSKIFQIESLNLFTAEEICNLIEGEIPRITKKELKDNVEISHGYTESSPQIQMLFDTIEEMTNEEQSLFVKFITGCSRLPIGGLKSLSPKLVFAKRAVEEKENPDNSLPSVMTCTNYFKIPEYSSKNILKEKILVAIKEGQGTFLLT